MDVSLHHELRKYQLLQTGGISAHNRSKTRHSGRSSKLCIEDMLLTALGYLREYRTYAHLAVDFGIAESNLFRAVR
jgi:hypothetical protein